MIGLRRGTVKLIPYQKQWVRNFEREKKALFKKLGKTPVDIVHIGSTSIPGLPAKPLIDISIGVKNLNSVRKFIKPMDALGYHFHKKIGKRMFFAKSPDARRTYYVHVAKYGSAQWKNDLCFRDYLRTHPAQAKTYARLKRKLAKLHPNNRFSYTKGKASFINKIIKRAR